MKQVGSFILLFIFCAWSVISCSDDSDDEFENSQFKGKMEAIINGELIVFFRASGYGYYDLDNDCTEPIHVIHGTWEFRAPNGHTIALRFRPSDGIGTYNPKAYYSTYKGEYNDGHNSVTYYQVMGDIDHGGLVTLTSDSNGRYKGIFRFTAVNSGSAAKQGLPEKVVVTEGKFEINHLRNPCE